MASPVSSVSPASRVFLRFSLFGACLIFVPAVLPAQQFASLESLPNAPMPQQTTAAMAEVGTITGMVADVANGIVPGATVELISASKQTAETKSDSEGHFEFKDVPPGEYRIKISSTGLQTFESNSIGLKPGEHYELPMTGLPIASADQSVDVVLTQSQIADQEIADQTKQRVLGVLPNFFTSYEWNAAPMNTKQKVKLTLRATIDPVAFITTGIVAGIEQERNTFPDYGGGGVGYAKRYGAAYGDAFIGRFIGLAVLPSIFHQDPRYFYMGPPSTVKQRLVHAVSFSVVTRGDNGKLQPAYSHLLGNFIAGYISKTYHPDKNRGITLAIDNALIGLGGAAVQGLTREFLYRHISSHTPRYAHGKPASEVAPAKP
jgi:hypothetical protein